MAASVVCLQFYDGYVSVYTRAFPILAAENVPGMAMVIPSLVGALTTKATEQELLEMQEDGWDVCYHANSSAELPNLSDSELYEELGGARQLLVQYGFQPGARFAFPYQFHAHARELREAKRAGFVAMMSNDSDGNLSPSSSYTLNTPITSAHDAITLATVTAAIDAAKTAGNQILCLGFHDVVAAGAVGLETSDARLQAVIDYVVDTAKLSIVTFSDLVPAAV